MRLLRTILFFLATLSLNVVFIDSAEAQINRRQIKKNNRKMRNYRGPGSNFSKRLRYTYFGANISSLNYFGDLAPASRWGSTNLSFTRPALGVTYAQRMGPFYTLRADFSYGTLIGSDFDSADPQGDISKFRYVRNLQFRNRIKELSIQGVLDLYKNNNTYISRAQQTPYIYFGLSVFHHNPQAKVNDNSTLAEAGQWVDLQPLGTEGQFSNLPDTVMNAGISPYSLFQISIPIGIGYRYRINDLIDVSIETGVRYLFTDYIDDVSENYVDLVHLNSDLARELSDRSQETTSAVTNSPRDMNQVNEVGGPLLPTKDGNYMTFGGYGREFRDNVRGNKNDNDMYFVTTIRVNYIIGQKFRKAKFR